MHKFGNLLTAREVSEVLSVDRSTILRMVKRGVIAPVTQLPGLTGSYLFDRSQIEALKDTQGANHE
ncbi:helix-turn-helix domain-containing protein [Populibacterium corticicola]